MISIRASRFKKTPNPYRVRYIWVKHIYKQKKHRAIHCICEQHIIKKLLEII